MSSRLQRFGFRGVIITQTNSRTHREPSLVPHPILLAYAPAPILPTLGCRPMRRSRTSLLSICTILALIGLPRPTFGVDESMTREQAEFFETKIRPVLVRECYECHSAGSKAVKGGLRLDTRESVAEGGDSGPAVVPGKPEESPLLLAIRYEEYEMPPKRKLSESVAADFERWIRMGAPDPRIRQATTGESPAAKSAPTDFWAFRPPVRHEAPKVSDTAWARDDIDRFVLSRLEGAGLKPAAEADRRTWIRRVHMDMTGLPPSPEEVVRFLDDKSPDAFEKEVDAVLASPHYGERWGRYWLDLARYAEDQAHTFKARMYPNGYQYRDWVVAALNDDMPYDRFLKYQIAGDLMGGPEAYRHRAALGLFALGPVYYQDNGEKDKALADEWDDRLDTLMRGAQAMTVACARCHDHKFDPISMGDYYGLAGVFASSDYQEAPAVPQSVVEARRRADGAAADSQLALDAFLAEKAPTARLKLVDRIPAYAQAARKLIRESGKSAPAEKKVRETARAAGLNGPLLTRWTKWLTASPDSLPVKAGRPYLAAWQAYRKKYLGEGKSAEADSPEALAEFEQIVNRWVAEAREAIAARDSLAREFGENYAFLKAEDRTTVEPGLIPLGNLFDNRKGTPLRTALISDPFLSAASTDSLGVHRIQQGWGDTVTIAEGIRVRTGALGADKNTHGKIVNDGWSEDGGLRTKGAKADPKLGRTEQGIGMHANALITFDLDEIRKAGLISGATPLRFVVDRAGINDDAFGQSGDVHIAVIVSKPQIDRSRFDSILSAHVDGQPVKLIEDDTLYKFEGAIPPKIEADGRFVAFDVPLPPESRFLTLMTTGARTTDDENVNAITSDHAVLSGARLVFDAGEARLVEAAEPKQAPAPDPADRNRREAQALLLSELFDDEGVLGMPADAIGDLLEKNDASKRDALRGSLARQKEAAESIAVPMVHTLTEGAARDLNVYLAGDPKRKGNLAPRKFPQVMNPGAQQRFSETASGRLELAEAIASDANPLTARVIVNRVWAGHFGTGLVKTLNNFGQLGDRPSHPELLDTLAAEFMKSGWSLKWLHRRILLSTTYRQTSRAENASAVEMDPENRLLWRMNRRRLEVEPWRDTILAVSGRLDRSVGGPSKPLDDGNVRRTFYGYVSRHKLDELLRLFDFPDPNITAGERPVTTVPLQQLFVINSDFMIDQARALAARLEKDADQFDDCIRRGFELAFGRLPSDEEAAEAAAFLADAPTDAADRLKPLEQLCLALLGANELAYVD